MFGHKALREETDKAVSRLLDEIVRLEAKMRPEVDLSGILGRLEGLESAPSPDADYQELVDQVDTFKQVVADVLGDMKELTIAVSEGIERTARTERRIKSTVKRARKELAESGVEDEGLEAEDEELRLVDGEGSDGAGLQPMRPAVEEREEEASSVPGVTKRQMRRIRGFR